MNFAPRVLAPSTARLPSLVAAMGVVLLGLSPASGADVIRLKSGQSVTGEVLKETPRDVVVDVGFDVLRVPLDQIESRETVSKDGATGEADASEAEVSEYPNSIFRVAKDGVTKSVLELTKTLGEAVVLVSTPSGLGSGFLINDRGYVITNFHVVEGETRLNVTLFLSGDDSDLTRRRIDDVEILALNPFMDLALLRVPKPDDYEFKTVPLATDDSLEEGQTVFAIGNPLGLERSVSQGIVSTRTRNISGLTYIQTTTQINPGNSGGPLFDTKGRVVGVTNMKLLGGDGLGFAIPVRYVKDFLRNREAFAYDRNQPNTGYRYLDAPRRRSFEDTTAKSEDAPSAG